MCDLFFPGHVHPTAKNVNPLAHVKTFFLKMKKAGYVVYSDPQPNDLMVLNSRGDSDAGEGWHIAIVKIRDGNQVHTVEGNVSNVVGTRSHSADDKRIMGYIRHPGLRDTQLVG